MENAQKILAFVGSYAEQQNPSLYTCQYDTASGALELLFQTDGLKNPTFLDVSNDHSKLYTIGEGVDENNQRCGVAAAYAIDPANGELELLNQEVTLPSPTCYIILDHTNKCLIITSYHGGMIGMSSVLEDGQIAKTANIVQHTGSSLLPVQDQARAHSIFIDRANRFLGVCDLGLDRIIMYKLDIANCSFIPHGEVQLSPGSGPRHFSLHPTLDFGYVINELNSTVTAFNYKAELGELTEIQVISTLPDTYTADNACADIHISPDGKFLYGSNRGHDSIVVYGINQESGLLSLIQHSSTLGKHPRNFALSPDGQFLLVANKDTNNIVTFNRDLDSGKLMPTGHVLNISMPVCIKFAAYS